MTEPLLTLPQVAEITQLSVWTVRRAIDAGELRAIRIRSRVRVSRADLDAWLEASAIPAPSGKTVASAPRPRAPSRKFASRVRAAHPERPEGQSTVAGALARSW